MNMLVCRVSLLKNRKETVSVGEEEKDQNLNMLVCRVLLLRTGRRRCQWVRRRRIRT